LTVSRATLIQSTRLTWSHFSVLKDASATAVHGVRGANGVDLVMTKCGSVSKLKITARTNVTFSTLTKMLEYLRAYDYASLLNEVPAGCDSVPRYTAREMNVIRYGLDPGMSPINHTGNSTNEMFTGMMTMSIHQDLKFLLNGRQPETARTGSLRQYVLFR
jgi:TonB-dependent SusC/RagA subfamily outer membrane receptor